MESDSPQASAYELRRLREAGVLPRAGAAALETLLRERLPWPLWIGRTLLAMGAGLLLAGVVSFFAWNWAALPPAGKFALLEGGLVLCALAAWRAGLAELGGKIALFAACVVLGVCLAVHGQIYQTGADSWVLFAAWAALALPWVALARFPALWVFWLALVNFAVALCANETSRFFFLGVRAGVGILTLHALLNAAALAAWEAGVARGWLWMNESWVRASLVVAVFGLQTVAVCLVILDLDQQRPGWFALAIWGGLSVAGYWFYRQRRPSLPCLTAVILSFCAVLVTALGHALLKGTHDPIGLFFLLALLVLGIFGGAVFWLRAVGRVLRARQEGALE